MNSSAWARCAASASSSSRGPGAADPQVGGDGVVEQETVLEHHSHRLAQRGQAELATSTPVEGHRPGLGVVQAGQQGQDGGLARPGGPHHGHDFAPGYRQFKAVQDGPAQTAGARAAGGAAVREADPVETDRPRPGAKGWGAVGSSTSLRREMMLSSR